MSLPASIDRHGSLDVAIRRPPPGNREPQVQLVDWSDNEEEDGEHGTSIPMRPPTSAFTRSASFGCLQLIVGSDAYQQYRARQHEQPDRPCTACLPIMEDSGKEVLEDTLEVLETPCQTAVLV